MGQFDAERILREQGQMETDRANFDTLRQDVAELMLPRQAEFLVGSGSFARQSQGRNRMQRIFDETAMLAMDHGVAVFEGEVIPQGGMWQSLVGDEAVMKNLRVRQWFEEKTNLLFALRNSPRSGFASQIHESTCSLFAFGEQATWPDILRDPAGRPMGLSYRSEHIGTIYHREDHRGVIVKVHRKFDMTHRQALAAWPDHPPQAALKGQRDNQLDQSATYIHVIEPNTNFQPGRIDAAGKPFASCYFETSQREVFGEGGYRTMPCIVSRYEKSPNEEYGRGPGMTVLPAVRSTQQMFADIVTAIEFAARPALAAHDDLLDQVLKYAPGQVTFGAIDERGNPMIRQIFENADIQTAQALLQDTRARINAAFFVDLYLARQEMKTHITAQEIMQRDYEKGVLLAPLKRQETDWFTPMADRELDLMNDMGLLDDMPEEVRESGGIYHVRYDNPLGRARQMNEASGYYQLLNNLTPMMQADQSGELLQEFRERYPFLKVLPALGRIHGVPASWEASEDERAAAENDRKAKAGATDLLQIGGAAAQIASSLNGAGGGEGLPNAA